MLNACWYECVLLYFVVSLNGNITVMKISIKLDIMVLDRIMTLIQWINEVIKCLYNVIYWNDIVIISHLFHLLLIHIGEATVWSLVFVWGYYIL